MDKDFIFNTFDELERSVGKIDFNSDQKIEGKGIFIRNTKHRLESFEASIEGEEVELEYVIVRKKNNKVEFLKIPNNLKKEIKIIMNDEERVFWKILGLNSELKIFKKSPIEENKILTFVPELDIETNSIYQFIIGDYINTEFKLINVTEYDENYRKNNFWSEEIYKLSRYFSHSFKTFSLYINDLNRIKFKYYVISNVDLPTFKTIIEAKIKDSKDRETYIIMSNFAEFVENCTVWFNILDLFSGWYFKIEKAFKEYTWDSPIEYLNYINNRSKINKFKKQRGVTLNYIKKVSDALISKEENTNKNKFDIFDKNALIINVLNLLFTTKGGVCE